MSLFLRCPLIVLLTSLFVATHAFAQVPPKDIAIIPADNSKTLRLRYRAQVNQETPITIGSVTSNVGISSPDLAQDSFAQAQAAVFIDRFALRGPVHFLYNGFLRMQNVLGLFNKSGSPATVSAIVLNPEGAELSRTSFNIAAGEQRDILLNVLAGFAPDTVGSVRLEFPGDGIDGAGFLYRYNPSADELEFSAGLPLHNGLQGETVVTFNTFQPSRAVSQSQNEVMNWLTLGNMDADSSQDYTLEFRGADGGLIRSETLTIPALGRRDVEAGHVNPGPNNIGSIRIIPSSPHEPYAASVIRYGASGPIGALSKFFHFAMSHEARPGSELGLSIPVSNGANGESWIVITNTEADPASYVLNVYNNSGVRVDSQVINLNGYAQQHVFASSMLAAGSSGLAFISPVADARYVAESNTYFYDPARGFEATAAYAVQASLAVGPSLYGSYNTFLNQLNYVKASGRVESTVVRSGLTVFDSSGNPRGAMDVFLGADQGLDLLLEGLAFAPDANSVGIFRVDQPISESIAASMLRVEFPSGSTSVNGALALPVR
jgi:hypothetical protein